MNKRCHSLTLSATAEIAEPAGWPSLSWTNKFTGKEPLGWLTQANSSKAPLTADVAKWAPHAPQLRSQEYVSGPHVVPFQRCRTYLRYYPYSPLFTLLPPPRLTFFLQRTFFVSGPHHDMAREVAPVLTPL